jgi:hypothetical protein
MKTLQQQYILIKEGKGNKDHFLKQARNLFPEFITPINDYNTTVHILKSKSILNEGVGGVITSNPNKPDWFKIFDTNLKEAIGVKNTKEYGDQNEFEKIDKNVQDALDHQFDNKDEKNIDNVYGQSFLMGYYTEMKDPKNADKTIDELKAIVLKNMVKDINYYHTEASFGVKGIGYTKDVVGGGDPVAPKGKFKSSGYGDMPKAKVVKEGIHDRNILSRPLSNPDVKPLERSPEEIAKDADRRSEMMLKTKYYQEISDPTISDEELRYMLGGKGVSGFGGTPNAIEKIISNRNINEGKKSNVHTRIKDLEKQNEVLALESKITALDEAINELTQKVSLSESDDLAEMMDPKKINELKKDIKILEKYKMTCEKKLSKLGGKKTVVDNEEINENENPYFDSDPSDGDRDFDMEQSILANELYDKGLEAYSEGDLLKAERLYKGALKAGSYLSWTEFDLPPYETLNK